jgi:hypothetical protein
VPVAELLERELELQALTATVETVRSGHGAAVFVRGEAGIGTTNAQIAAALHLSERTVAHHVSAVLGKLAAPNRTAAVEVARGAGLLHDKR